MCRSSGSLRTWCLAQIPPAHERLPIQLNQQRFGLLAPTGALIVIVVYYISGAAATFQIYPQSINVFDVTSVTLSRLNSINVIDVTRC